MATVQATTRLPGQVLVRNEAVLGRDQRGSPDQEAGDRRRTNRRFRLSGVVLPVAFIAVAAIAYRGVHFSSAGPVSAVASQELATPELMKDLRNGPVTTQPVAVLNSVPQQLQDISVTIRAAGGEGSGVLRRSKDGTTWVWTAAHVVAGLRKTRQVVDPITGMTRTVIEFDDAKVIKLLIENGRTVGRVQVDAQVVRYSDASHGEDLALLRIRKKDFGDASVSFYEENNPPLRGSELYHCGSLLGEFGANSLTEGILSQYGRLIDGKVYDQVSTPSFPGSSGGGVYLKSDGRLVGLLVRGAPGGFSLIVPTRRMEEWAKRAHVEWAIRDDVPMPSHEDLEKLPVED